MSYDQYYEVKYGEYIDNIMKKNDQIFNLSKEDIIKNGELTEKYKLAKKEREEVRRKIIREKGEYQQGAIQLFNYLLKKIEAEENEIIKERSSPEFIKKLIMEKNDKFDKKTQELYKIKKEIENEDIFKQKIEEGSKEIERNYNSVFEGIKKLENKEKEDQIKKQKEEYERKIKAEKEAKEKKFYLDSKQFVKDKTALDKFAILYKRYGEALSSVKNKKKDNVYLESKTFEENLDNINKLIEMYTRREMEDKYYNKNIVIENLMNDLDLNAEQISKNDKDFLSYLDLEFEDNKEKFYNFITKSLDKINNELEFINNKTKRRTVPQSDLGCCVGENKCIIM